MALYIDLDLPHRCNAITNILVCSISNLLVN